MNKVEKAYKENVKYVTLLIPIVAIIAKLIEHLVLPAKYYYDNLRIVSTVNNPEFAERWPGSYEVAADFFRNINIFHFTTLLQWSIFLGIIFNILLIILFSMNKGLDIKQAFFALMCVGILNIYIFNIGKDAIQILIFLLIFAIINLNINNFLKTIGCFVVLYWESTFYKNYYIILAFFFLAIQLGIFLFGKRKKKASILRALFIIFLLYVLVFSFLFLAQKFMPSDYQGIMDCKKGVEVMQANSMIDDKIEHGGNLILYMENYVINSIRMVFPIELIKGGIYYIPFVVFEFFLIYYIRKAIFRLYVMDFKQILALSVFLAYFLGSVLFEPDFGSFVRHEASTFPILYILIFNPDNWNIQTLR